MLLRSEWEGREEQQQQWVLRADIFFPNFGHFSQPPSLDICLSYSIWISWRDCERWVQYQLRVNTAIKLLSVCEAAWAKGLPLVRHHSKILEGSTRMNLDHLSFTGFFQQERTRMQCLKHWFISVLKGIDPFFPWQGSTCFYNCFPASQILFKRNTLWVTDLCKHPCKCSVE